MVKGCVFCRLVKGELPCDKVYEDDLVLAFLDIAPLTRGHTLLVPREHHTSATTLTPALAARMMEMAPRIGAALMRAVDAGGFNLILSNGTVAGQVVPHVHLHIVPRHADDGIVLPHDTVRYGSEEHKNEILERVRARLAAPERGGGTGAA
ncbi:MAG: HIT family protein [Lentisphaeria bacterium]|nr:HIT family protein [Lentisphaeria bacterium]